MIRSILTSRCIACLSGCVATFPVSSAHSQTTFHWVGGSSGAWETDSNWDLGSVPDDEEHVAVVEGATVKLTSNITVGELIIDEESALHIRSDGELCIDSGRDTRGIVIVESNRSNQGEIRICGGASLILADNDGSTHQIGGRIMLLSATSTLRILGDDVGLGPFGSEYGALIGSDDKATIQIAPTLIVDNLVRIEGRLTVSRDIQCGENPILKNSGLICANDGGSIELSSGIDLVDESGSIWRSSHDESSTLRFCQSTSLQGIIIVEDCAILELCPGVSLTAKQISISGTIVAHPGASFGTIAEGETITTPDCRQ